MVAHRVVAWGSLVVGCCVSRCAAEPGGGVLEVDAPRLAASADLVLDGPVDRSEAGLPIGNGRMGTLLWTKPSALHMQVNRVDVFGNNKDTNSFPERHTDFCGGCAWVDLAVGGTAFTERMTQRLSCREGLATLDGEGVRIRALAWADADVIALEVADQRATPSPISVSLRMLRPTNARHFEHSATSTLAERDGRIVLTQAFEEGDYYCGSAVGVAVVGRQVQVENIGEQELRLVAEAGAGSFTVLISSAASFDRGDDLTGRAAALLDAAAAKGFAGLLAANEAWWREFWNCGFIWLRSDDGAADAVQQHYYYYYLYLMASTSRGKYPTKFNGMLWTTGGDRRQWGGQYWGANQSCLYNALFATNRLELLDPLFDMYSGMSDSLAVAARQQWDSQGVFIPETHGFDGLAELPDDVAAEMRDLYLVRKPMSDASDRFLEFARMKQPHSSRWNWWESGAMVDGLWRPRQRPEAPFGAVTHIFSRGGKIAYMFWQRYEYTRDEAWLRDRAYPMLRGVAEFYRNFPNVRRGDDGKYHIHHVNSNESIRDARDTDEELAAIRGVLSAAIRASEILGIDAELRTMWQEFLDTVAPLPTSDHPDAVALRDRGGRQRDRRDSRPETGPTWIRALPPVRSGGGLGRPDGNTMPMWFFDLCTLENPDAATMAIANATLDGYGYRGGVLSKVPVTNAMMGRADAVRRMLPAQLASPDRAPVMANRMDLREGSQTTSAQRLGRAADTLHNVLVQSVGPGPATEPVIRVFPAWPRDWDAAFTLLCRGGFLVTASLQDGKIEFVAIDSQRGGLCRVRNPWTDVAVALYRGEILAGDMNGALLEFETSPAERLTLVPAGSMPQQFRQFLPATNETMD